MSCCKHGKTTTWSLIVVFIVGAMVGYFLAHQSSITEQGGPTLPAIRVPESSVVFLPDKAYYGNLTLLLDTANKSVYIIMYVMKYDPKEYNDPVNILLRKLVELHDKGVDVKIIVDDETYDSYPETIEYLRQNNIPVKLDESSGRTTHVKLVIIDEKIVLIGSHNWTESALTENHETTLLVNSEELAKQAVEYFNSIWSNARAIA